jgi:TM2 domain-containing membrane protein YozV
VTARTFGRKGQAYDEEMARRREAFVAEERARRAKLEEETGSSAAAAPSGGRASFGSAAPPSAGFQGPRKSMFVAYLFWFGLGGIGAHRFYLGYTTTGFVLACLWMIGWAAVISLNVLGLIPILVWAFWVVGDAFLIPGMIRNANNPRAGNLDARQVFS